MKIRITGAATLLLPALAALTLALQPILIAHIGPLHVVLAHFAAYAKDLDMHAVPPLTREAIRTVQQALQKKGFDPGTIDGNLGRRTEQAVRKFQDTYGINASGRIDNQTLYALGQPQLASEPKQ
jgi:Putative peptidoglycan binding domain